MTLSNRISYRIDPLYTRFNDFWVVDTGETNVPYRKIETGTPRLKRQDAYVSDWKVIAVPANDVLHLEGFRHRVVLETAGSKSIFLHHPD